MVVKIAQAEIVMGDKLSFPEDPDELIAYISSVLSSKYVGRPAYTNMMEVIEADARALFMRGCAFYGINIRPELLHWSATIDDSRCFSLRLSFANVRLEEVDYEERAEPREELPGLLRLDRRVVAAGHNGIFVVGASRLEALLGLVMLINARLPRCTCDMADTAHQANPMGHNMRCPAWGTMAPNRAEPNWKGLGTSPAPYTLDRLHEALKNGAKAPKKDTDG
jgi:hypothetical protein